MAGISSLGGMACITLAIDCSTLLFFESYTPTKCTINQFLVQITTQPQTTHGNITEPSVQFSECANVRRQRLPVRLAQVAQRRRRRQAERWVRQR